MMARVLSEAVADCSLLSGLTSWPDWALYSLMAVHLLMLVVILIDWLGAH